MSDFRTILEREYIPKQTLGYQLLLSTKGNIVELLSFLKELSLLNQASLDAFLKDRTVFEATLERHFRQYDYGKQHHDTWEFYLGLFGDMILYHHYYQSRGKKHQLIPLIKDFQAECAKAKDCESQPDVDVSLSVLTYLNDNHWNFDSYFGNMRDYILLRQQSPLTAKPETPTDHTKFVALATAGVAAAALIGFAVQQQRIKKRKKQSRR